MILEKYDNETLLRKQKKILNELCQKENGNYVTKKIAILSGSTTTYIKNLLEIFLLDAEIKPVFYESEYNKFYEDAVFGNDELDKFKPEIVIIFTSVVNLSFNDDEYNKFLTIWQKISEKFNSVIIQNNFDFKPDSPLGNLETVQGSKKFIDELNIKFSNYAESHDNFYIHDLNYLSSQLGLNKWHNRNQYYAYKFAMDYELMPEVANNLSKIIRAILGKNKKCLVLDLDNTLWGGIISEDGIDNLQIGHETPEAESFTEFQNYVKKLKDRGVILAVCSKNDDDIAKSGFDHPDSILKVEDFSAFYANWQPKNINIQKIANELNIGLDSIVFIDDNPAERQIVRESLPEVAVPEIDPSDVFSYIKAIEHAGYFETIKISEDDLQRSKLYNERRQRLEAEINFSNYDDFLKSLNMTAEIAPFKKIYFDRIAQLTNKSNQFNLTTRRFTRAEIESMANDEKFLTLYARLEDKFGDNGLVSVIIGEKINDELKIILWLMSCRVLKRDLEYKMLDVLVENAKSIGIKNLIGIYSPTPKNKMVENMYKDMGFSFFKQENLNTLWKVCTDNYQPKKNFIELR